MIILKYPLAITKRYDILDLGNCHNLGGYDAYFSNLFSGFSNRIS